MARVRRRHVAKGPGPDRLAQEPLPSLPELDAEKAGRVRGVIRGERGERSAKWIGPGPGDWGQDRGHGGGEEGIERFLTRVGGREGIDTVRRPPCGNTGIRGTFTQRGRPRGRRSGFRRKIRKH